MAPTALIVDDEPEANKLLALLIQLRGYRTISALTGTEALDAFERETPDIVFLDLMLPDVPGYDVCRQIKSRPATALIPVVMVTARVAWENRLQSFRLGADEYVAKPYTADELFDALNDVCRWTGPRGQPARDGEIPFNSAPEGETVRNLAAPAQPVARDDAARHRRRRSDLLGPGIALGSRFGMGSGTPGRAGRRSALSSLPRLRRIYLERRIELVP